MVERLYGVSHAAYDPLTFETISTRPSQELLTEIAQLPKDSSVGIEVCQEFCLSGGPPEVLSWDGQEIITPQTQVSYWQEIIDACQKLNLPVIFLDDPMVYQEMAAKRLEAEQYKSQIMALIHSQKEGQKSVMSYEESVRDLVEAGHRADVQIEYLFQVVREQRVLEKIKETNPTLAIIGRGHGDIIIINGLLSSQGITQGCYQIETFAPAKITRPFGPMDRLPTFLSDKPPDQEFVLRRELLRRRHCAATQWRILPEKSPDFIGTWNPKIRPAGLFEIYIIRHESNKFWGVIEDVYGTASCLGLWEGENIEFLKRYDPEKSRDQASGGIFYIGRSMSDNVDNLYALWETMPPALIDSAFDDQQEFDLWKLIPDAQLYWRPFLIYQGDKFKT